MPGAGFNFQDVRSVFTDAAAAMEPGSFVFMDDLTLHDAMGAFEIGEPRLDSGLTATGQPINQFNPLSPLLPQELCWILDRSFSCEMEWHSGNLLSHTVFTMLYVHFLAELDFEYMPPQPLARFDSSRPPELLFLILKPWVMGMLKCCDLSWRELSKGGVQDSPYSGATPFAQESYYEKRLKTFVPLRVIPVPPPEDTWRAVDALLDGWQEASLLAQAHSLATWEAVGNLRVWLPDPRLRIPYIRSYTQSIFYDGLLILNKFSFTWMVERFFYETLGITYYDIVKTVARHCPSNESPLPPIERIIHKLITPHIRGLLYDALTELTSELEKHNLPKSDIVTQLPTVALVWRLSAIREVVFSAFQLELFALEERPLAYWYSAQVMEEHLSCLDKLLSLVNKESPAYQEIQFQYQLLTALQALSTTAFVASMSLLSLDWNRMRPAFLRRYKWAFRPEYDNFKTPAVGHPMLYRISTVCADAFEDELFSPSGSVEMAQSILSGLIDSGSSGGFAGLWAMDRMRFLRHLVQACEGLRDLPTSMREIEAFDVKTLKWDVNVHPWFPFIELKGP
ncbi:hypothetical protein DXG03_007367 [Asterophora parasitica]|uniref:NAA35-like N-terminal domain-containing protein n=1 Tax=Asterophora parasitica TaxID=117018 RepID=A0A9P7K863_9AGAR|nr:hypothetical protein DXG03_007367 [Asterophora parasitica]